MTFTACAPARADLHRLVVEAQPAANTLLRLLEPLVVHDVLPLHLDSRAEDGVLRVVLTFHAPRDLAERLAMRLSVQPPVLRADLEPMADGLASAAA